jgi:predicted benzoate:H+ symporter BenE
MKLSGEALGNVTPASHLGGELAKAYMLRGSVALTRGLPSLVINKTMEIISGLAFVLLGVGLAFRRLPLPMDVRNAMVAALVLATLVIAVATLKQQSNTFTWILDLRWTGISRPSIGATEGDS